MHRLLIGATAAALLMVPACGDDDDGTDMVPGNPTDNSMTDDSMMDDSMTDMSPGTVSNDNSGTP